MQHPVMPNSPPDARFPSEPATYSAPNDIPVQASSAIPIELPTTLSEADQASSLSPAPPVPVLLPRSSKNAAKAVEPMIDPSLASLPAPPLQSAQTLSITESIALAPQPRTSDFTMMSLNDDAEEPTLNAIGEDGVADSPVVKVAKTIAPPNAGQSDPKWMPVGFAFSPLTL
jgi:hypothetical protein